MQLQISKKGLSRQKSGKGTFITFESDEAFSEKIFTLGTLTDLKHFTACYRWNACWVMPKTGTDIKDMPEEIQHLITYDGKNYCLIYALVDMVARTSLFGGDGVIKAVCETGDDGTKVNSALGVYIIEGKDPYALNRIAHEEIAARLGTCSLMENKVVPKFADMLGFCTYNAFYDKVSHENLVKLLDAFKAGGVKLGFVLIDAGWQDSVGNYTNSFKADPVKFPEGLKYTVDTLKQEYGLKEVLCWHTYNGYWCGLNPESFPQYRIENRNFWVPQRIWKLMDKIELSDTTATAGFNFFATNMVHEVCGVMQDDLFRFYFDFYSELRKQGVDGSKLDAMAWIEAFGQGRGGRVAMMRQLVSSLEGASAVNFDEEHINCSCCSNDFIYNSLKSSVIRSSTDYFENIAESHGLHLYTNAHTSFWFKEMFLPDWDMFQSGNTAGNYHAMSRAISGGPIYCSDNLKSVDFDILKRLSTEDGELGRCLDTARVTQDCFFTDPIKEKKLLKVFNRNPGNYVIGAFNCYYDKDADVKCTGTARISDIYSLKKGADKYAVYSLRDGFLGVHGAEYGKELSLGRFQGDILTFAPVKNGAAVIGLTDKFNPGGFVRKIASGKNSLTLTLTGKGKVVIYSARAPKNCSDTYEYKDNILTVNAAGKRIKIDY